MAWGWGCVGAGHGLPHPLLNPGKAPGSWVPRETGWGEGRADPTHKLKDRDVPGTVQGTVWEGSLEEEDWLSWAVRSRREGWGVLEALDPAPAPPYAPRP